MTLDLLKAEDDIVLSRFRLGDSVDRLAADYNVAEKHVVALLKIYSNSIAEAESVLLHRKRGMSPHRIALLEGISVYKVRAYLLVHAPNAPSNSESRAYYFRVATLLEGGASRAECMVEIRSLWRNRNSRRLADSALDTLIRRVEGTLQPSRCESAGVAPLGDLSWSEFIDRVEGGESPRLIAERAGVYYTELREWAHRNGRSIAS